MLGTPDLAPAMPDAPADSEVVEVFHTPTGWSILIALIRTVSEYKQWFEQVSRLYQREGPAVNGRIAHLVTLSGCGTSASALQPVIGSVTIMPMDHALSSRGISASGRSAGPESGSLGRVHPAERRSQPGSRRTCGYEEPGGVGVGGCAGGRGAGP